jgi:hypothetical protein
LVDHIQYHLYKILIDYLQDFFFQYVFVGFIGFFSIGYLRFVGVWIWVFEFFISLWFLVVCIFLSSLGAGIWWCRSPPGFSV